MGRRRAFAPDGSSAAGATACPGAGRQTFASSSCRQVFSHGRAEPAPHFSSSGPGPFQDSVFSAVDTPGYVLPRVKLTQVCPSPAAKRLVPAEVPELGGLRLLRSVAHCSLKVSRLYHQGSVCLPGKEWERQPGCDHLPVFALSVTLTLGPAALRRLSADARRPTCFGTQVTARAALCFLEATNPK